MKKRLTLSVCVILLIVLVALMCVACTPSFNGLKKKYEKAGYMVLTQSKGENGFSEEYEGVIKILGAAKKDNLNERVTIFWFSNSKNLDKAYKGEKQHLDEFKKEYREENGTEFDYKIVKKGKALIMGTSAAVKIAE